MTYEFQVSLNRNELFPVIVPEMATVTHGQLVIVRTENGEEVGKISRIPQIVQFAWLKESTPKPVSLIRPVGTADRESLNEKKIRELQALQKCKTMVQKHNLSMHLVSAYYTFDRSKLTFFFTSPQRIDFRELLKDLTQEFRRVRIDLRHIGARDEAALYGGAGPCGKELCCSTWLRDFKPVNITLAKDQNMPLNPQKVTGNCGRLMCCLNYEYEMYLEAARKMPRLGAGVRTEHGKGRVMSLQFVKEEVAVRHEDGHFAHFKYQDCTVLAAEETVDVPMPFQLQNEMRDVPDSNN
jgi:cell fate regulator YaaT (PSP1 superfamily)